MKILINHIGYDTNDSKKAIIEAPKDTSFSNYSIINKATGKEVKSGPINYSGPVAKWKDWQFFTLDFSELTENGEYYISFEANGEKKHSHVFVIKKHLVQNKTLSNLLYYFKSQRCSGIWDIQDHKVPFYGDREGTVDVHGGWYDASGDKSKYFSHLAYANYMNPQQTPMVVWNFLAAYDQLPKKEWSDIGSVLYERIMEEACHGADFLVRMQDPEGYFYMIVFDRWSAEIDQREICAYRTQSGYKSDDCQVAYRQGGGVAIAALARVSTYKVYGDYTAKEYLDAAIKGFDHLEENNLKYCNDGKENIIDDYCALLAATELYNASKDNRFLEAARKRADSLIGRLSSDENYTGWFRADDAGDKPYFHAAEAGLPVIALARYEEVETDAAKKAAAADAIKRSLEFELTITNEVNNPFGYPRQYVNSLQGPKRGAFFFPHENESGYWWQGENARLGSLSAAARIGMKYVDGDAKDKLKRYSDDQINWILGLNPFDMCSMYGYGRNNAEYETGYFNAPGGICNGATGGYEDEEDIDFLPKGIGENPDHRWRWSEQWIPHPSWFFLAVSCNS